MQSAALDAADTPRISEDGSIQGSMAVISPQLVRCTETWSADPDASYIRGVHTAPANESETTHLQTALAVCDFKPTRVYADKGYASAGNRAALRAKQLKSAIMHREYRNEPLTTRQIKTNKLIGRTRYIVEQSFGTAKRLFDMVRNRYMGIHKANVQFMLKAANKITLCAAIVT